MMNKPKTTYPTGCREWRDQIPALLDWRRDDEIAALWRDHAARCPECRAALETEQALRADLKRLPDPGPAAIADNVMRRVRSLAPAPARFRARDLGLGLGGAVLGAALGFVIAAAPNRVANADVNPVAGYEYVLSDMAPDYDEFITELLTDAEADQ